MHNDLSSVPRCVVITNIPGDIPVYSLHPPLRSPLRRSQDVIEFVLLKQPTRSGTDTVLSVPDVLGINGETQIGLARASRIMQPGQTSKPVAPSSEGCSLCADPNRQGDRPAIQLDNIRPFGPLLHKIVFSKDHVDTLGDIEIAEVLDSVDQFYEIATDLATVAEASDGLAIGMNFGEYMRCGASQSHFHYQVTGLGPANYNPGDRLGALCRAYRLVHPEADYLTDYETALRDADMITAEASNGLAFAYAPISPRFKGEVQIMVRRRSDGGQAGNILQTTAEERLALAELQCVIIRRFAVLGCQALNQVWFTTRFSDKGDCGQRLIVSFCPRTSIVAFYELLGNSVIDTLPWKATRTLRIAQPPDFNLRP